VNKFVALNRLTSTVLAGRQANSLANLVLGLAAVFFFITATRQVLLERSRSAPIVPLRAGVALPDVGLKWNPSTRTIVVALAEDCPYSAQSAPFYNRLSQNRSAAVTIAAIVPRETRSAGILLNRVGLKVEQFAKADLGRLGVVGTPTVLSVDARGIILATWIGVLADAQQQQVLTHMQTGELPAAEPLQGQADDLIDSSELRKWISKGRHFSMIDLREREEFRRGHFQGFINIPFVEIESRVEELGDAEDVVAYCGIKACLRTDGQPGLPAGPCLAGKRLLLSLGFKSVRVLAADVEKPDSNALPVVFQEASR
jgi:hypothetical protein